MRRINSKASRLAAAVAAIFLSFSPAAKAQAAPEANRPKCCTVMPAGTPALPKRVIVISIPDRKLALVEDGQVVKTYDVAVGRDVSPTPTGTFTIANRITNPTYYQPGKVIPAGRNNPLGTRWIGLSEKHYAIHGTSEPRSIGKAASHGCVRMGAKDVAELFRLVRVGDAVEIHGERDAQTAQIFGEQPVVTAQVQAAGGR